MSDNDLIRRGDAIQQATRWLRGMIETDTIGGALKAIPAVQTTVKALEGALRGMMDREARIALQGNEHKPLWEASHEWIAAYNALAASIPADPVTNAGCCQAVEAERDDLRAKLDEAVAVLGWYSYQFCEGFCKDFPSDKYTDKNCEHDCDGCKARATLAKIKGANHE